MNPEPVLVLGGVELSNSFRTLTYLRRGLAGPAWSVELADVIQAEGLGYRDAYVDVYEPEPFRTDNLNCYCATADEGSPSWASAYQSPDYDPAPWFDAQVVGSEDFLGFVTTRVSIEPVIQRTVRERAGDGAEVGRRRAKGRVVNVKGYLVAVSACGMDAGVRWLAGRLAGGACPEGCVPDTLTLWPCCDEDGARTLADFGVVDGPVVSPANDSIAECLVQNVSFQAVAGWPYLLSDEVECATLEDISSGYVDAYSGVYTPEGGSVLSCDLVAPPSGTRRSIVVTVRSGTPATVSGITVTMTGGTCAEPDAVVFTYEIAALPPNVTLVVDASRHVVTRSDGGALEALDWDGLFEWMESCGNACITLDASAATLNLDTFAGISYVDAEL